MIMAPLQAAPTEERLMENNKRIRHGIIDLWKERRALQRMHKAWPRDRRGQITETDKKTDPFRAKTELCVDGT